MNFRRFRSLVLLGTVILISLGQVSSYYNLSYNGYTLLVPDNSTYQSQRWAVNRSFSEAQQWCTNAVTGSILPTIPNKVVQGDIVKFLFSVFAENLFGRIRGISFSNIRVNGKYHITNTWSWVTGSPNQDIDVRNQSNGRNSYAYLSSRDYRVYAAEPQTPCYYICEFPDSYRDCDFKLSEGRCYKIRSRLLTWFEARNDCLDGGGDLASFPTLNDFHFLRNLSLNSTTATPSYCIGMQKNEWRWEDTSSAIRYSNWSPRLPFKFAGQCLCLRYMLSAAVWTDCSCSEPYPFICLLSAMQSTTVSTTETQSTTASITEMQSTTALTTSMPSTTPSANAANDQSFLISTVGFALLASFAPMSFIVIIVIAAVLLTKKQRVRRRANSARYESPKRNKTTEVEVYSYVPGPHCRQVREPKYLEVQESNYEEIQESNHTELRECHSYVPGSYYRQVQEPNYLEIQESNYEEIQEANCEEIQESNHK